MAAPGLAYQLQTKRDGTKLSPMPAIVGDDARAKFPSLNPVLGTGYYMERLPNSLYKYNDQNVYLTRAQ